MTSCFKVLFRFPGIHNSKTTNCHGSQKELLYGDVRDDANHALPPYSSPENSGLQFNNDKIVSLDDADHALPPYSLLENSGLQFNDDKLVSTMLKNAHSRS